MPKQMRRKDKALTEADSLAILERGEMGVLATVGEDGQPYAVPLNYACKDRTIYFHCAPDGHKIDNIAANPRVSFCVVADCELIAEKFSTRYKSVIVFGTAREVADAEKIEGLRILVRRLCPDHIEAGESYIKNAADKTRVFRIDIDQVSGKRGKD